MNEETKDCARLPVVAYVHPLYLKPNALGFEASACRLAAAQVGLCLADGAQALLAQKDARIAQLAAHARGKNKALANALKEIERLKTISDNYCALLMDANQKLQAAPAERGVDDIRSAAARAYGFLWHVNNEPGTPSPMYSADKAAYRARVALRDQLTNEERGKAIVAVGIELGRYDPATADSDVREVSE